MLPSEMDRVVDSRLKVHGTSNVRIVNSLVFRSSCVAIPRIMCMQLLGELLT
ncbi:hypothetical protein BDW62DRAFT_180744 [Aspergillus aurantiobrunneus]